MKSNHHQASRKGNYRNLSFLLVIAFFLTGCSQKTPVELNFAFGPEDSGTIHKLIKDFNKAHKGEIQVNWQEGSRLSNEFYRQIENDFAAETPTMDIIGADVVWTAAFAQAGWVEDVSNQFYEHFQTGDFIEAALNSTIYQSRIWGMPWYTDAGVLYYRKDLLEANGFNHPPATWEELRQMAKTVMQNNGPKYGYVFQGANYEGGIANACEFIWNSGGNILISDLSIGTTADEPPTNVNIITINSEAAKNGLQEAYEMIHSGVAPAEVSTFQELQTSEAFANGDAVFMRAWPTAYPHLQEENAVVKPDQIELAPLPVSAVGMQSFSCLGGWNLMINKRISDDKKAAAWTFIQFLAEAPQQKLMAMKGGTLPSLQSLYEDEQLLAKAPMVKFAKQVVKNTRVRPITPKYMELSPDMAWTFNEVLKGNLNPTEAVETMQGQMEGVLAANEAKL